MAIEKNKHGIQWVIIGIILLLTFSQKNFAADFDISGEWTNCGSTAYGQCSPGKTVIFQDGKCNLNTSADSYSLESGNAGDYTLMVSNFLDASIILSVKVLSMDSIELTAKDGTVVSLIRNESSAADVSKDNTTSKESTPAENKESEMSELQQDAAQAVSPPQPAGSVVLRVSDPAERFYETGVQNIVDSLPAPEAFSFPGKDEKAFYQILREKVRGYSLGFSYYIDAAGSIPEYADLTGVMWALFDDLSGNGDPEFAVLYRAADTVANGVPYSVLDIYDYHADGPSLMYSGALVSGFLPGYVSYEGYPCLFVQELNGDYKLLTLRDGAISELHSATTDGKTYVVDGNPVSQDDYWNTCNTWSSLPRENSQEIKVLAITDTATGYDAQDIYVNQDVIKTLENVTGLKATE